MFSHSIIPSYHSRLQASNLLSGKAHHAGGEHEELTQNDHAKASGASVAPRQHAALFLRQEPGVEGNGPPDPTARQLAPGR